MGHADEMMQDSFNWLAKAHLGSIFDKIDKPEMEDKTIKPVSISEIAMAYAISKHQSTGHLYNGHPYHYHLAQAVGVADKFKHLIPDDDFKTVLGAVWCHDLIEDCRQTYNDVKQNTNEQVADLVYAMTNEKGKNRTQRANDKYYQGLRDIKYGVFVKLCDRIANVEFSKQTGSRMMDMYGKEHENFVSKIWVPGYDEMFAYMNNIFTK